VGNPKSEAAGTGVLDLGRYNYGGRRYFAAAGDCSASHANLHQCACSHRYQYRTEPAYFDASDIPHEHTLPNEYITPHEYPTANQYTWANEYSRTNQYSGTYEDTKTKADPQADQYTQGYHWHGSLGFFWGAQIRVRVEIWCSGLVNQRIAILF